MKFECQKCGKCCKIFEPGSEGIVIFEFERDKFLSLAKQYGVDKDIFIKKRDSVMYAISFRTECPFLKENRCGIYEERPLYCRTFPLDNFSTDANGKFTINFCSICPQSKNLVEGQENTQIKRSDMLKELYEYYGEVLLWNLEMEFLKDYTDNLMRLLNVPFNQKLNLIKTSLSKNIISKTEFSQMLEAVYNLKHSKDLLNKLFKERGWQTVE